MFENSQHKPCSCSTCLPWGKRPCPDRAPEAESQDWPAVGPCCSSPPCRLCSSRRRSPDPRSPTHPHTPGQPSGLRVPGRVWETEIQRAGEVPGCGRLGHPEPPASPPGDYLPVCGGAQGQAAAVGVGEGGPEDGRRAAAGGTTIGTREPGSQHAQTAHHWPLRLAPSPQKEQ